MSETDLVSLFTSKLEALQLPYMVTGSIAGVLYGEPRVTHDVDIVLQLKTQEQAGAICAAFPLTEFYCPPADIIYDELLRSQRGHFNLIHHASGFKADIYLAARDPFHLWALQERKLFPLNDHNISVAPIEYVIVRKLEFYREGGSEKHLRDIRAMLHVSASLVRHEVIERWIEHLGLQAQWKIVLNQD